MALSITKPTTATVFGTASSDDYLLGTAGDDTISGGVESIVYTLNIDGIDTMEGGLGDDKYIVNETTDVVTEYAGEGIDTVFTTVSYTLATELENIVATAASGITLTGNAKDNVLDGSQSTNTDTLIGGSGNDTYILGTGDVVNADSSGVDTVMADSENINISSASSGGHFAANSATVIENVTLTAAGSDNDGATDANITGNALNNRLTGNTGDNLIDGGAGNDILDTGAANTDTATGGVGGDTLVGGTGNDTYIIRSGVTFTITETSGGGTDKVLSFADVNVSSNDIENVTLLGSTTGTDIVGNALNNVLVGNTVANSIEGGSGNDTLNGGGGADSLDGGSGNDTYIADAIDEITELSNEGTDTVQLGGTNTAEFALPDNVENINLTGTANLKATGASSTTAHTMNGNTGNNSLTGGAGNDTLSGGLGDDTLAGGSGNDALTGGDGADSLTGGDGNDTLNSGTGTDTLNGGAGNDLYLVDKGADSITDSAGTDSVQITPASLETSFTITAGIENITLTGSTAGITVTASGTTNNIMTDNSAANTLVGGAGNDALSGNAGNDSLSGGAGNDTLNGGTGNDTMNGSTGADTYIVDSASDVISGEAASALTSELDTVQAGFASGTFTLSTNVENITLTGSTAISATGNASKNVMTGNAAINTLDGDAGNDKLIGLAGNDILIGGDGDDTITGGTGQDTVTVHDSVTTDQNTIVFATGVTDSVATSASIAGVDLYSDLILNEDTVDLIDLTVVVANVGPAVTVAGVLSASAFIGDMNTALHVATNGFDTDTSGDIAAAVVTFQNSTSGNTADDRDFLAVDLNKDGSFTAADFVIEITGSTVTSLTVDSFV